MEQLVTADAKVADLYGIKRGYDAKITTEHPSLLQQTIKKETNQYIKNKIV